MAEQELEREKEVKVAKAPAIAPETYPNPARCPRTLLAEAKKSTSQAAQARTPGSDPDKTARLVAESLELTDDEWVLTFQSRVGRQEWLRPYTDETVRKLGEAGLSRLDVVCPGFAADCLETLEEIAMQNAEIFEEAGGGELKYIPALNARDDHVEFLTRLVEQHIGGWPESSPDWNASDAAREQDKSRERALAMGADA